MSDQRFVLIRGGRIYAPEPLESRDVLFFDGRIVAVGNDLSLPAGLSGETIDADGRRVSPGLIDLHVHLLGGGGEAGPTSRLPEICLSALTTAGVTTAVGVLGTDAVTRSLPALLAKVKALRADGLSAYMHTGSYAVPTTTITGSIRSDIALIDEVVGVKVAISDHRSAQPTFAELSRMAAEARTGGLLGGKAGLVHLHVGAGASRLGPLRRLVEETEIPIAQYLPTHVARTNELLDDAIAFARRGGPIDLTACAGQAAGVESAIGRLREAEVPWRLVTLSSDGNGSMPRFDADGRLVGLAAGKVSSLIEALRTLSRDSGVGFSEALALVTSHPAERLRLGDRKGRLHAGYDADIILWNDDLTPDLVVANGRTMVAGGHPQVKGAFE